MSTPPRVLAIRTHVDPILALVAPVGLAAAAGTALVIDLDPGGLPYPGDRSLATLLIEGPRRSELAPERPGVAVLPGGGASWGEAAEIVGELSRRWPAIVLRVGEAGEWPLVPVVPLLPGFLTPTGRRAAVWQAGLRGERPPGPGPVLPPLGRALLTRLLCLQTPAASRWVRAWDQVWRLPWR